MIQRLVFAGGRLTGGIAHHCDAGDVTCQHTDPCRQDTDGPAPRQVTPHRPQPTSQYSLTHPQYQDDQETQAQHHVVHQVKHHHVRTVY